MYQCLCPTILLHVCLVNLDLNIDQVQVSECPCTRVDDPVRGNERSYLVLQPRLLQTSLLPASDDRPSPQRSLCLYLQQSSTTLLFLSLQSQLSCPFIDAFITLRSQLTCAITKWASVSYTSVTQCYKCSGLHEPHLLRVMLAQQATGFNPTDHHQCFHIFIDISSNIRFLHFIYN